MNTWEMILMSELQVISYTLRDIKDEENYMESMGQARTSEVRRDARIGEAECNRSVTSYAPKPSQVCLKTN